MAQKSSHEYFLTKCTSVALACWHLSRSQSKFRVPAHYHVIGCPRNDTVVYLLGFALPGITKCGE